MAQLLTGKLNTDHYPSDYSGATRYFWVDFYWEYGKMNKNSEEYMIGRKFGRLTVIESGGEHYFPGGKHSDTWICKCDCGIIKTIFGYHLRSGRSKSCGCSKKEGTRRTHGKSHTKIYNIWHGMRERCNNKKHKNYKHYGGRGIKVCDEWNNSLDKFCEWAMANGYQEGLTIDRIDVNGNYEPSNCRWATMKEQNRNRRNNRYLTYNGKRKTMAEWSEITGLKDSTIQYRLDKIGWPVEKALTERSLRS